MQTRPFLPFPAGWTDEPPEIVGTAAVHRFLARFTAGLAETRHDRDKVPAARSGERPVGPLQR
jgi:hypothetical protein